MSGIVNKRKCVCERERGGGRNKEIGGVGVQMDKETVNKQHERETLTS